MWKLENTNTEVPSCCCRLMRTGESRNCVVSNCAGTTSPVSFYSARMGRMPRIFGPLGTLPFPSVAIWGWLLCWCCCWIYHITWMGQSVFFKVTRLNKTRKPGWSLNHHTNSVIKTNHCHLLENNTIRPVVFIQLVLVACCKMWQSKAMRCHLM